MINNRIPLGGDRRTQPASKSAEQTALQLGLISPELLTQPRQTAAEKAFELGLIKELPQQTVRKSGAQKALELGLISPELLTQPRQTAAQKAFELGLIKELPPQSSPDPLDPSSCPPGHRPEVFACTASIPPSCSTRCVPDGAQTDLRVQQAVRRIQQSEQITGDHQITTAAQIAQRAQQVVADATEAVTASSIMEKLGIGASYVPGPGASAPASAMPTGMPGAWAPPASPGGPPCDLMPFYTLFMGVAEIVGVMLERALRQELAVAGRDSQTPMPTTGFVDVAASLLPTAIDFVSKGIEGTQNQKVDSDAQLGAPGILEPHPIESVMATSNAIRDYLNDVLYQEVPIPGPISLHRNSPPPSRSGWTWSVPARECGFLPGAHPHAARENFRPPAVEKKHKGCPKWLVDKANSDNNTFRYVKFWGDPGTTLVALFPKTDWRGMPVIQSIEGTILGQGSKRATRHVRSLIVMPKFPFADVLAIGAHYLARLASECALIVNDPLLVRWQEIASEYGKYVTGTPYEKYLALWGNEIQAGMQMCHGRSQIGRRLSAPTVGCSWGQGAGRPVRRIR